MLKPVIVFLGAGTGGVLRYWLGGLVQAWWGPSFPLGTLAVNISGCLAMGFLAAAWTEPGVMREEHRLAVLVGMLGGYTTFSSFGLETLLLARDSQWLRAGLYVLGSVALCLVAAWLGHAFASKVFGAGAG